MTATARAALTSLTARTRLLDDDVDPLDFLGEGGFAWLHEGDALATSGVAARIVVGRGPERLARAAEEVARVLEGIGGDDTVGLPGTGPIAVGSLPFADSSAGELIVPANVVGRTAEGQAWVTEIRPANEARRASRGGGPSGCSVVAGESVPFWTAAVRAALGRIADGELTKVVLARRLMVRGDRPFDPVAIVDRLRHVYPSCFTFASGGFVGASPELLVRRRGQRVVSCPMAGSVGRGVSPAEDDLLVAALVSSAKDLDEHRLVVDAVVGGLEGVCQEVTATGAPDVVRLATVAHLASTVGGRLNGGEPALSALALAGVLHPTPAVGGLPRGRALAAIAELERFDREGYAGPVGWVDSRGDGDWAVALRCAHLDGASATLVAGAGIVAGSDPDAEWRETEAKLEPMLRAVAG